MTSTADLLDRHGDAAAVCSAAMRSFGGRVAFEGTIATVRCFEDNALVRRRLSEPGAGRVLVVDGRASTRVALLGDVVASIAVEHGWSGVVINGCVRDVAALGRLDLGVRALGANPRPSGKKGEGEVDVQVTFGDVTFGPGDRLASDDDGTVVIPRV
jgi:regulator of ribonuclease activity A